MRCTSGVRKAHCALAFVMPNSFSSALMMWLAGVPTRVGYLRDARALLLTHALPRPSHEDGSFRPIYMADYYLALCETMGLVPDSRRLELPFTEADMDAARAILDRAGVDLGRPFFLLHPGAGYGASKRWPVERYAVLAGMLQQEFGAQVACIGGPDARPLTALIRQGAGATVLDLTDCGITLHMLKGVVRLSDLLVTTDSGPRHYGIALGVPTVCLMGPTKPEYTASRQPNDVVVRVDVPCGPCQKKRCRGDHRCMNRITAGMVLEACRAALPMGGRRADGQT
jgi:heptosyltransferase-2